MPGLYGILLSLSCSAMNHPLETTRRHCSNVGVCLPVGYTSYMGMEDCP
jgi:hypothetical protein